MKLLPTKQNLGHMKIKTPEKSSHRSMFEQFMAIKDTIFLSSVLYILIKAAVTFQKSRFYCFE